MTPPDTLNALTLFARSWKVTLGTLLNTLGICFLLLFLPTALWVGWMIAFGDSAPEAAVGISCLAVTLLLLLISPLVMASINYSTFQYLRGERVSLGESLRATFPCLLHVGLTLISVTFLFMVGYMACIIPGIIIYVGLYVAIPVATVERLSAPEAISRSWALTRGYRLSLFVFMLLMQLLNYAFLVPMSLLETVGGGDIAAAILGFLAMAVLFLGGVISLVSYGVAYHDLRHLQEGDLGEDVVEVFE